MSISSRNPKKILLAGIKKDLSGVIEQIKYYKVKEDELSNPNDDGVAVNMTITPEFQQLVSKNLTISKVVACDGTLECIMALEYDLPGNLVLIVYSKEK